MNYVYVPNTLDPNENDTLNHYLQDHAHVYVQ